MDDGQNQAATALTIDTFLTIAKRQLTAEQTARINQLENSISRGAVKDQQIHVYHTLARFYSDTANAFEPFAWYTAEAARLENSEKNLTFAAHLFLDNLQHDEAVQRKQWKALQAKDLFERSLKINPDNDSAKVRAGENGRVIARRQRKRKRPGARPESGVGNGSREIGMAARIVRTPRHGNCQKQQPKAALPKSTGSFHPVRGSVAKGARFDAALTLPP